MSAHLHVSQRSNSIQSPTPASREVFKNFMGREYNPISSNSLEHVVYNLFKHCKKPKQNIHLDFDLKIDYLHPLNQMAILTKSREIAVANIQSLLAWQLSHRLAYLEDKVTIAAPLTFNPGLEEKRVNTILKVIALAILSNVITTAIKSPVLAIRQFREIYLDEKDSKARKRDDTIEEETSKAVEGDIYALDRLEALHRESPVAGIEQIREDCAQHIAKQTEIRGKDLAEKETAIADRNKAIEEEKEKALKGDIFAMSRLKVLHKQSPVPNYEQILKTSNEAIANEKAQKESELQSQIEELTAKALSDRLSPRDRLNAVLEKSKMSVFEKHDVLDDFEKDVKRVKDLKHHIPQAARGNSSSMNSLECIHRDSEIPGMDEIRIAYDKARASKNEGEIREHAPKAVMGDSFSMRKLEVLHRDSPVPEMDSIRAQYDKAKEHKVIGYQGIGWQPRR